MTDLSAVTYELDGPVAVIRIDDGKANALSHTIVTALDEALRRALTDDVGAIAIIGRPGRFSAGFDLNVMRAGPQEARDLLHAGALLALRLYSSPVPVVLGVTGHALAMGAILLLSTDWRIGESGDYKIGLNEVAIGMPVPALAVELARDRLSPRHLTAAVNLARIYDPRGAVEAGFLDEVVDHDAVPDAAVTHARGLAEGLHRAAFRLTRANLRGERAERLEEILAVDIAAFSVS